MDDLERYFSGLYTRVRIQALSGNGMEFSPEETAMLFGYMERIAQAEQRRRGSWADDVVRAA